MREQARWSGPEAQRSARPASVRPLAGIALAATIVLLAVGYVAFVLWPRQLSEAPSDAPSVPITVAGVVFDVPPAAIRQPVQRRSGAQERIDLAFLWPSLEPPDPAHPERHAPSDEPLPIDRLFMTIARSDGTLPPVERMKIIYPRYLTAGAGEAEAEGLVVRHFGDATPYRGEDLVFDAASPEHMLARCSRPGATPGICLLERRIGAADIIVRFPRDWLTGWRDVAAKIDKLIQTLRPPGR